MTEATEQNGIVLANLPAGPTERRVAFAVALPLLGIAAAVVPFASVQFPRIDGWIPITNTYIFVADLVTWVLLISQFDIARRPALLVLASGYLYTALMAVPLLLSFPSAFTPSGLFGAGSQTNGWLSAFWVSGYPLAFIGYAMLKDSEPGVLLSHRSTRTGVALSVAVSIVIVVALTWITTAGEPYLPKLSGQKPSNGQHPRNWRAFIAAERRCPPPAVVAAKIGYRSMANGGREWIDGECIGRVDP